MRAPLSVVIPTRNAEAGLGPCLAALGPGLQAGLIRELVIADGGSTDATRRIAEAAGAVWVGGPPGRGPQLARGVAAASGPWLLLLHADTTLSPEWPDAVFDAMAMGRPGYFRLRFDATGPGAALTAAWANTRARTFGLPFGDQGLLLSRADYNAAGGYPEIPLMEDLALSRALTRAGRRPRPLAASATTSASRYQARGWFRHGAANLWRQVRFLAGADPAKLLRGYRK